MEIITGFTDIYILCASYLVNLVRVYQNNQVVLAQNSVRLSAVALVNPR